MSDLDMKRPAIIGGLIVGLGSVIPFISVLNCCFCAWAIIGGIVASKVLIDSSPRPIELGDGAKAGAFAGMVGGGIYLIGVPILSLMGGLSNMMLGAIERIAENANNPELQEQMRRVIEQAANQTAAQRLIGSIPMAIGGAIILVGFTVLGGLLGAKMLEKRKGMVPPPPPGYPPAGGGWPPAGN